MPIRCRIPLPVLAVSLLAIQFASVPVLAGFDERAAIRDPGDVPVAAPTAIPPAAPKRSSLGSGFVVDAAGTVLTDSHVVARCKGIHVTPDGTRIPQDASVIARDTVNDLAALKTGLTGLPAAAFREDKPIRPGDGVVAIGYPLSDFLSQEPNVTTGVVSALAGIHGDARYYQVTAPIQHGSSGGPLADMGGNVVGIVEFKLNPVPIRWKFDELPENVNFATKQDVIRKFLADNSIAFRTAPARNGLSAADVAEGLRQSMVLVECEQ